MRKTTRNAAGSGTIRQRSDGRWEARYTVGRCPGTGKQIQKSVYGETQAEVRKKLQQIAVDIENGTYTELPKMTVGQWLDIWLKDYNGDVKPRTHALYTGQVNHRIKPALGAVKLSALKPHDIQAFINNQGQNGNLPALSPKSIKNIHGILHKSLEQALLCGYIKANPSNACKIPRWEKPDIKPLDDKQITAFLKVIKGHRYEIFFMVDLFTGLRQSELIGLTWDCIQGYTLYIYRQLQLIDGQYVFGTLKNDKTRRITPAPYVMQLLREQKQRQEKMQLQAGLAWSNPKNLIFTNEQGENLKIRTIQKSFKHIMKNLGIPSTRFHDMRHSYAVISLQAGDDVKTVQENMGHHTAAFTLDVYGHVSERMKKESANRMEVFIQSVAE